MKSTTQHVLYQQYLRIRVIILNAREDLIQLSFYSRLRVEEDRADEGHGAEGKGLDEGHRDPVRRGVVTHLGKSV